MSPGEETHVGVIPLYKFVNRLSAFIVWFYEQGGL